MALASCSLPYTAIQQAVVGYVYGWPTTSAAAVTPAGDSTCGQRALYQVGLTGIPIYNVRRRTVDAADRARSTTTAAPAARRSSWRSSSSRAVRISAHHCPP